MRGGARAAPLAVSNVIGGGQLRGVPMDEMTQELGKALRELNEEQSRKEFGTFPESLPVGAFQVSTEIKEYLSKMDSELEKCRHLSVGTY
jgi:hypothetical protein